MDSPIPLTNSLSPKNSYHCYHIYSQYSNFIPVVTSACAYRSLLWQYWLITQNTLARPSSTLCGVRNNEHIVPTQVPLSVKKERKEKELWWITTTVLVCIVRARFR